MKGEFKKNLFSKCYVASPRKPDNFDDEVRKITGNRGRIVWGCDVRSDSNPQLLKYAHIAPFGIDRWVFETRINMDAFPREKWEESRNQIIVQSGTDAMGDYPRQMWGMKMPLVDMTPGNEGGYLPCNKQFLDWLRFNHYAWENAPSGKFASVEAYAKMMADTAQEQKEREAEAESNANDLIEYIETNRDAINASQTRSSVLVTPDGQPWQREAAIH